MLDSRFKKAPKVDGFLILGKDGDAGNDDNEGKDEPFLGTWKTKEDASEGLKNLQTKLSEQGNESGTLKKQLEEATTRMDDMGVKLKEAEDTAAKSASDQDKNTVKSEQAKINQQIADLDPVDEDYSKTLMTLMDKSNKIAAKSQHDLTLAAATDVFRKELDERDIKTAHQDFFGANPDFQTPEMQSRIKEYIAKDKTGMSDPLVAFREIQRDDAVIKATELEAQNTELMERLKLKKGTDETGTVILKGQGDQGAKPQQKTVGADRNKGMMDILSKMKE